MSATPRNTKREARTTRRPDRRSLIGATQRYKSARDDYAGTEGCTEALIAARSNLINAALTYVYGRRTKRQEGK